MIGLRATVLAAVFLAAIMGSAPARAAVGEFFWAGFQLSDPHAPKGLESFLIKKLDHRFRSRSKGAIRPLLERLKWDEFAYFESAASTGYAKENMRDVYGAFLSIDRVMQFRPTVTKTPDGEARKYYAYVFATLNLFAADSRNLIFSHPVFLVDVSRKRVATEAILDSTLAKLADQLKTASHPETKRISKRLQRYFGTPGQSLEAIRRTKEPIHPIDGYFADTWGVMAPCAECVNVMDQSEMIPPDLRAMGDFTRFFLTSKLSEHHQVAFVPEQAKLVQEKTGDAAATAKEGDIQRNFSEMCLPEYDETGRSRICVKVLPPRNPIYFGVRAMVQPEDGPGELIPLRCLAMVDLEAEVHGRKEPVANELSVEYAAAALKGEAVSDVYYINALIKALNQYDGKTLK